MKKSIETTGHTKTTAAAWSVFVLTLFLLMLIDRANAAEYQVVIENHMFVPSQIEMKAGEKHRLTVINHDATPEEFESYELNREKIIAGSSKATIFLPPLDPGTYPFFGEFNEATAQGRVVVK